MDKVFVVPELQALTDLRCALPARSMRRARSPTWFVSAFPMRPAADWVEESWMKENVPIVGTESAQRKQKECANFLVLLILHRLARAKVGPLDRLATITTLAK
jgi:hypothetical protein